MHIFLHYNDNNFFSYHIYECKGNRSTEKLCNNCRKRVPVKADGPRKWKWIILAIVVLFLICAVFLPLYILTWQTFMEVNGDYSLSNFTLHYWIGESGAIGKAGTLLGEGQAGILRDSEIYRGAWNSIKLSLVVSFLAAILGILLGYAIVRGRGTKLSVGCDVLSFAPYIFPVLHSVQFI